MGAGAGRARLIAEGSPGGVLSRSQLIKGGARGTRRVESMGPLVRGHALVLGDNIDTDVIIPSTYLHHTDPERLAEGVFSKTPEIRRRLDSLPRPVVIVAGRGFGYGSSREHAVIALRAAGVAAVAAESFHRIFYRNAINNGLLVVEAPRGLRENTRDGDPVEIDPEAGLVRIAGRAYRVKPLPRMILELLQRGGLRGELEKLAREGARP